MVDPRALLALNYKTAIWNSEKLYLLFFSYSVFYGKLQSAAIVSSQPILLLFLVSGPARPAASTALQSPPTHALAPALPTDCPTSNVQRNVKTSEMFSLRFPFISHNNTYPPGQPVFLPFSFRK